VFVASVPSVAVRPGDETTAANIVRREVPPPDAIV
jgi:hypothetical protein